MNLTYAEQPSPDGLAQAFVIGRDFVGSDAASLVLGDNIFYGAGFEAMVKRAASRERGATVFGYHVADPERYGIVSFDAQGRAQTIVEKPERPRSNFAVTGLYFYDNRVLDIAANLEPSARGQYEITDVNRKYLEWGEIEVERMGRGFAWRTMVRQRACSTRATSCRPSRSDRGKRSPVSKKSRSGRAGLGMRTLSASWQSTKRTTTDSTCAAS